MRFEVYRWWWVESNLVFVWSHSFLSRSSINIVVYPSKWPYIFIAQITTMKWQKFLIRRFKTKTQKSINSGSPAHPACVQSMLKRFRTHQQFRSNLNYYFYCNDNNYGYYYLSHEFWISFTIFHAIVLLCTLVDSQTHTHTHTHTVDINFKIFAPLRHSLMRIFWYFTSSTTEYDSVWRFCFFFRNKFEWACIGLGSMYMCVVTTNYQSLRSHFWV